MRVPVSAVKGCLSRSSDRARSLSPSAGAERSERSERSKRSERSDSLTLRSYDAAPELPPDTSQLEPAAFSLQSIQYF